MARTRASVAAKVVTGKSSKSRCSAAAPSSSSGKSGSGSKKSSRSYSGGNPVCRRETPKWQKPITNFFFPDQSAKTDGKAEPSQAGSSKAKPKRNVIYSDEEEDQTEKPIDKELDESIELEPLTGEGSHKINEYYTIKDKGVGKKSGKDKINKENIDSNITSNKRHLDEHEDDYDDDERDSKKIKVD